MPSPTTNEKRTSVRGLGEIALRVNNLDAMQKFYDEVIGLPLMARFPNCRVLQDCGRLRRPHSSACFIRPLTEPRLSRDRRINLHHRPHRIRDTSR